MPPAEPDATRPVKSADRTLAVLEALAAAPRRRSLGELSRALGIPKSSLHALLRTMASRGWVEADASGTAYGLGVRALRVGASYVESDDIVARVQPVLDWLSGQLGETVHLGRLDGTDVVYLAKRESIHPLRLYSAIGRRLPAYATALGKALLAQYPEEEVRAHLPRPLVRLTASTITDEAALRRELAATRARGYAVDDGENADGIRCLGVAIAVGGARATDALSLSFPATRLSRAEQERAAELLQEARRRAEDLCRGRG